MLCREITAVCSEFQPKHINTGVCAESRIFNVCYSELFNTYIILQWCVRQTQQNFILLCLLLYYGTAVAQFLRCCVTNRKAAGSIPRGVFGIFHFHNTYDRTMALGSTKLLTEMSTSIISWG